MMETHQKMNVPKDIDGIGSGTGAGSKMHKKMGYGLQLFLYIRSTMYVQIGRFFTTYSVETVRAFATACSV